MIAFEKIVTWAIHFCLSVFFLASLNTSLVYAQNLTPPLGSNHLKKATDVSATVFKNVQLEGGLTEVPLVLDPQDMVRFENSSNANLYRISVTTDAPSPLTLRVLQLELNEAGGVVSQKQLLRADVRGGQATSLKLPDTLLPVGPIFIGVGAKDKVNAKLKIDTVFEESAKPLLKKDALVLSDDRKVKGDQGAYCMTLPESKTGVDISITSEPGIQLQVSAYDKKTRGNLYETYKGRSRLDIVGMNSSIAKVICVMTWKNSGYYRIQTSVAQQLDEPDVNLSISDLPLLNSGESRTRTKSTGDTDVFRLPAAQAGKAYRLELSGIFGAKACFKKPGSPSFRDEECIGNVRSIFPFLGGDGVELRLSEMIGGDGSYIIKATEVDYDPKVDRVEPNADSLVSQSPPKPNSKNGMIRLQGSHMSSSDTDTYHWADIEKEQLWRIRAIGKGLVSGEILLDGKTSVRLSKAPGVQGRLQADDVFLTPGRAEITLKGDASDYTVFMRPLGPPLLGLNLREALMATVRYCDLIVSSRGSSSEAMLIATACHLQSQ